MITIDISIYATESIQQMLSKSDRENVGVRVFCVPG
jgi:hypothetical protein